MTDFLKKIIGLVAKRDVIVSSHGYEELFNDDIQIRDILQNMDSAEGIEYYPEYLKGPCILVLVFGKEDKPLHVVWGIPNGYESPAVLVTAYRPDPLKWTDHRRRKKDEKNNN